VAIFWPFAGMLALGVVLWIGVNKRPSWTDALLFMGTGAAGLLSARHIPLFAIVSAPIIAKYSWLLLQQWQMTDALIGQSVQPTNRLFSTLNWLLLALACFGTLFWVAKTVNENNAAIAGLYPVHAVDYLEISGLSERPGYNSYNWGGYLIWRDIPVFVDGRADVYGDSFLFFYRQAFDAGFNWQEPLDQYDVEYVLMERGSPLNSLLDLHPDWSEVYHDDVAQIFVRKEVNP
jgi:hypothetical protein